MSWNKTKCTSAEIKWYPYKADSRNSPKFKRETEFIQIQTKEHILRVQAKRKLRLNPNPKKKIFSNAVKNTSDPIRSKYPTNSEQESESDTSSEDTTIAGTSEAKPRKNSPTAPPYGYGYFTTEKGKKKRSPYSPPLAVGGVRVKKARK